MYLSLSLYIYIYIYIYIYVYIYIYINNTTKLKGACASAPRSSRGPWHSPLRKGRIG